MEWINVEIESVPIETWVIGSDGKNVYLFQENGNLMKEYLEQFSENKINTTHWMPLPKPPKEK